MSRLLEYLLQGHGQILSELFLSSEEDRRTLLKEIRDLLVLQLRHSGVSPEAIGRLLNLNAKTIRNRYPLKKGDTAETDTAQPAGQTEGNTTESA